MSSFRGITPQSHPKLVYSTAIIIGVVLGLGLASYVSGWPTAIWGAPSAQAQLADLGYKKVKDEKLPHEGLKRDVTTETWERTEEPQQVILSDDSPETTAGDLVVNAVNFRGTDGKGTASCQPNADKVRSHIRTMMEDARTVRDGIANGSLAPKRNSAGFPYSGKLVGCLP